nr:hypothetical protein K-LCC10_0227 [Kaumoebavirus]
MDPVIFNILCERVPKEIAHIIKDYLLRHPRAVAEMIKRCVERTWDNAIRVRDVHPFKYRVVLWLPYCTECGNRQIDTISNFVKVKDTDAEVKRELICGYDLFEWKPYGCAARWKS